MKNNMEEGEYAYGNYLPFTAKPIVLKNYNFTPLPTKIKVRWKQKPSKFYIDESVLIYMASEEHKRIQLIRTYSDMDVARLIKIRKFMNSFEGKELNMTREESLSFLSTLLEKVKNQTQEEFNIDSFLAVHREIERVYRNKIDYFLFQMRGVKCL